MGLGFRIHHTNLTESHLDIALHGSSSWARSASYSADHELVELAASHKPLHVKRCCLLTPKRPENPIEIRQTPTRASNRLTYLIVSCLPPAAWAAAL